MKTPFRLALASAAVFAAALPVDGFAQAARPAAGGAAQPALPHKVGLVDMSHVFSNYEKLKALRVQLQAEFETSTAKLKGIEAQLKTIQEELKAGTITKGSEQWTAKEQEFTNLAAQFQAEKSNLQREFVRKEVAMYKDVHGEVQQFVAMYADAFKYTLILRYQRDAETAEDGSEDPNKIMSRINQLVVYHQPGDDITDVLLQKLNERYAKSGTAAAPAASRTQR